MSKTLKMKIISYSILLSFLLNISISSITLSNNKLDLSITFSSIANTITYSYNPIQLTKELQDNLLGCLYKNAGKQNKKEDNKNTNGDKRKNFIVTPLYSYRIKTIKQLNNFDYDKSFMINDKYLLSTNNLLYSGFLHNSLASFAFYLILLSWLAIIFRKRRNFLQYIFLQKNI